MWGVWGGVGPKSTPVFWVANHESFGFFYLRKLKQAFTVDCFDDIVLLMPLLAPAAS